MSKPWVQIETPRQQQKEMLKAVTGNEVCKGIFWL